MLALWVAGVPISAFGERRGPILSSFGVLGPVLRLDAACEVGIRWYTPMVGCDVPQTSRECFAPQVIERELLHGGSLSC